PVTVTTTVTGAANQVLTGTINTGTLAPDATTNVLMTTTLNMTASGTYTFNAVTSMTGDGEPGNDAMPAANRVNAPIVALPETVDFTGYTGANLTTNFPNWYEADGASLPAGTISGWTSSTSIAGSGTTARINLAGSTDQEWIVGPKFTVSALTRLKFKVAITDASSANADPDGMAGNTSGIPTDDQVIVKISTNCGQSFSDLFVFDASNTASITNALVEQTIQLGAYAGQTVIIAFFATEGTVDDAPSYDFHIDDINISDPPALDAGALTLDAPNSAGGCYGTAETVTVTIKNFGTSTIDFTLNPVTVTTNVTGAAVATLNGTINSGTLAPDATTNVNMSATLDMSAGGTYTFNASTSMTGDGEASNDAMTPVNRVSQIVTLPQSVNFTGFTGSNLTTNFPNWREGSGATLPAGTTSAWTSSTAIAGSGTTAKILLSTASDEEWIVGPKFTAGAATRLKFKIAITDASSANADPDGMAGVTSGVPTDDQVIVKVSTDCGASYSDLYVFDASNTASITNVLEEQTIGLGAYAGQNIMVAIFATEGTVDDAPSYDFHIDDIEISTPPALDAGAIALFAPLPQPASGCLTATQPVTITIKNYGTATIDFSSNPVTVTTSITGAGAGLLTGTINAGTLAPDATMNVPMTGTLDMTAAGTYTFNASTSMTGDGEPSNNGMTAVNIINAPVVSLPQTVDFTGFTGSNLTSVFANWSEGDGASLPVGTSSSWTSSTVIPGSGTTAKILLSTASDQEWIVGPKFMAGASTRLKFKVAITESSSADADPDGMAGNTSGIPTDDQVIVRISTDCGATFSDLFTFDANNTASITNSLVEQTIQLGSYAGQTVIIAFFATEGTTDDASAYDFHIDDINIETPPAIDAGAISLVLPGVQTCYTNNETVTVRVKNYGLNTLDFSITPLTVNTNVSGVAVAALSGTVNSGTLAPDATVDVPMSATLDMSATGVYTFNASTTLAGDGLPGNDALNPAVNRTAVALVVGTASASTNAVCGSGAPVLTLSGSAGGNIQWQESTVSGSGPWNNVGTNSTTYTPDGPVSGPTWYQAIVSCGLNSGTSNVVSVGYLNPQVLTTTPASRCGFGTVDLQATGSGSSTLNWYSSASGGTVLGSGSPFTTPAIGTTTTFYVAATEGTTIKSVGAPSNGATGTYTLEAGLLFDVSAPSVTINGVYIYPIGTGAGTVNIALKNSGGTTLQSLSFPCTGTTSPGIKTYVPLNWTVNSGTDYYLDMTSRTGSVASLIRDVNADIVGGAIATNPAMTIPGLITITSGRLGSSGTSTSYYFFYDWQVSAPCEGARTAVTATVNPADPIIITPSSVVRCQFDAASNLAASSTYAYTNYTWSPGTGLNATSGANVQANPALTTEYTVTGTDGVCTDTAKVTVTVNLAPENVLASASPNPVCEGETVTLNSSAVLPASIPRFILNGNCGTGFIDISASGTSVPGTLLDDSEHNITIPAFTFNGVSYTTARVGMNGAIVLGSTTGDVSSTNAALPSTANTAGNLLIAPFWDDLDTLVTSSIKTETIGSVFIIQYTNLVHFSYAGGSITFQVQLDLNTGVITFVYQDAEFGDPTYDFAAAATIGVQVSSSSAVQYSSNTASLSNGQCISFTPNLISYSWTGPNSFVSAVQNPVLSNVVTLNAGTYTVTFSAANGCSSSASVNLTVNTPSGILAGSPGGPPVSKTTMISGLTTFNESGTCKLIATVNPSGTSPVSGNVTAKVWIENSVPVHGANPFVARHYEINAATNPATSTGTVTLYFTQGEFDAFNADAGSTLNLPANSADASGIANLRVIRYPGTSSDGSGHPATYSGIPIMIDPADVNINWNAGFSRWEISFDVTGFSGFTVGTSSTLNLCPSGGFAIPAGASGTSYQWQLNTGSGFNNIADGPNYNGSGTATLILTNLPSSFSGYQYQALVDNVPAVVYTVKFVLTWQGSTSTNWHTASNWGACGVIPDQYTDVVIPSGKSLYPVLSTNGSAKSVKAAPGSTVTVSTGAVLDITGQ
ncbi:MAG TPA: hypothetical protein VFX58_06830, partial [Chitinophagaceae bacterium]|nr:hypothetical protein [Chitinophagaceae bacterium]